MILLKRCSFIGGKVDEVDEVPKNGKKTIKKLGTDNGSKYLSKEFTELRKSNYSCHQLANVYIMHHNRME